MNDISKLTLSDEELQLVKNSDWILTKRIIIDKVNQLFGDLAENQKVIIDKEKDSLPLEVIKSTPKISKGENYLQLPYLLLDYPRCFDAEDTFAIRTMFWWGNFFSITLHLSGTHKLLLEEKIVKNKKIAELYDFYLCVNESQWHHHFTADNYIAVQQLSDQEFENIIQQKKFIKIAIKYPLNEWEKIHVLLEKSFSDIIKLLRT